MANILQGMLKHWEHAEEVQQASKLYKLRMFALWTYGASQKTKKYFFMIFFPCFFLII